MNKSESTDLIDVNHLNAEDIDTLFGAHLHNHTEYSIQDAPCRIKDSLKRAKELGYTAYGIADHGTIQGWLDFDIACKQLNMKGIFGVEGYENVESSLFKKDPHDNTKMHHAVFFARNMKGIKFIRKLATHFGKLENAYMGKKKRFNMFQLDFLMQHKDEIKDNVIFLTGCMQGRLPMLLRKGKKNEAIKYMDFLTEIFGKENIFIEVQDHNIPEEKEGNDLCIEFAQKYGYELVATNDIHYVKKEDWKAREIITARSFGKTWTEHEERNNGKFLKELYIKDKKEMGSLFLHIPKALTNSQKIVDMCEYIDLEEKEWHFPNIDIPKGHTPKSYYRELAYNNLPKKLPVNTMSKEEYNEIIERLEYEIDVIDKMNSSAYMLIDQDFIVWAKDHNIAVGPGRGSACGSLSAFLTGITDVNPLDYTLLFERFMSTERVTMPDYMLIVA